MPLTPLAQVKNARGSLGTQSHCHLPSLTPGCLGLPPSPQELATDVLMQILVLPLADSTSSKKPGYTLNPGFFIYSWGDNTHAFRFQD